MRTTFRALTAAELREGLGHPDGPTTDKIMDGLDANCRAFLAHSPFCCIATTGRAGGSDCSPRGDYPGFVRVLDDRTLVIPDRVGNRLADSMVNLIETGRIGLLSFVPGMQETLRINGSAIVTDDADLMRMLEQDRVVPTHAIVVRTEQVYLHCGRALLRGGLWDPGMQDLAGALPSAGTFWADASGLPPEVAAQIDELVAGAPQALY